MKHQPSCVNQPIKPNQSIESNQPIEPAYLTRASLRRALRNKRRQLTPYQQQQASQLICRHLSQQAWFINASSLAIYMAADGEVDPIKLAVMAHNRGKEVYLPVLHPVHRNYLLFVRFTPQTPLEKNRFGILEPRLKGYGLKRHNHCTTQRLDLILMPLVGFDSQGGRLGMGGGFYDRTLALKPAEFNRPKLVGLAHECQKVEHLPLEAWDIPLAGIITPAKVYLA
ncbi:MAG: 5-formyltetrahydrofolate cyclo-ligase [Pseudomonadaceae bacterium]|nr:5-formyltetrahydrofolate cyclo-ligase [Pseudomonadaceae bacterium]